MLTKVEQIGSVAALLRNAASASSTSSSSSGRPRRAGAPGPRLAKLGSAMNSMNRSTAPRGCRLRSQSRLLALPAASSAAGRAYWTDNTNQIPFAALDGSGGGVLPLSGGTLEPSARSSAIDSATSRIYWVGETGTVSFADSRRHRPRRPQHHWSDLQPASRRDDRSRRRAHLLGELRQHRLRQSRRLRRRHPEHTAPLPSSRRRVLPSTPAAGRIYWATITSDEIGYANLDGSGGGRAQYDRCRHQRTRRRRDRPHCQTALLVQQRRRAADRLRQSRRLRGRRQPQRQRRQHPVPPRRRDRPRSPARLLGRAKNRPARSPMPTSAAAAAACCRPLGASVQYVRLPILQDPPHSRCGAVARRHQPPSARRSASRRGA